MLFKHKNLLEELRLHGRKGTGEILSMKTLAEVSGPRAMFAPDEDLTSGHTDCWMKLRVVPDELAEAPFDATVMTRIQTFKFQGSHVPVWYDPADHSRVVVDYEADVERAMHAQQGLKRAEQDYDLVAHRYDQRLGLAWTPVWGVLLPVEVAAMAGVGRLTADTELGDLLREPARAAVSYVSRSAVELLPELDGAWFATHDVRVFQPFGRVPDGVTEVDAASAGLAIAVALVSLLCGRIVRTDVALTGSITETGELGPVDELKKKAAAVKRSYIQRLVTPAPTGHSRQPSGQTQGRDLEEVYVSDLSEALRAALAKHRVKGYEPPA
ncbi:MAG: S16 family serine protease [Solirubrobacteraceae bacterium]